VHAFAHVTGGGLAGNLARVLPPTADVVIERASWRPPPIFDLIARSGGVEQAELERTFNLGVGMVAIVGSPDADRALALLRERDVPAWAAGEVLPGTGGVRLRGGHA
jgi:phosphoribosylformylglycinamidine cyclo-ligase